MASGNSFTIQAAPLVLNGQALSGGVGINYDLGPSVLDTAAAVLPWVGAQQANAQAFLGQTIVNGQNFFAGQVQPIAQGIAQAVQASATTTPAVQQAVLAPFLPSSTQGGPSFISQLVDKFTGLVNNLASTQAQVSSNSLQIIQSNNAASIASSNASAAAANSGGGGCFITTAICEAEGKPDDCDELEALRAFRDDKLARMPGGPAMIERYYAEAPAIVAGILARDDARQILAHLRECYLDDALHAVRAGADEIALAIYRRMFDYASKFAGEAQS